MPECKTCAYFHPPEPGKQKGQCRHSPPVVVGFADSAIGAYTVTEWPKVRESDGCGKHSGTVATP